MTKSHQVVLALVPGIVFIAVITLSLGYYWWQLYRKIERDSTVGRSAAIPAILEGYFYWVIAPTIKLLARRNITPNHVTSASLFLSLGVGVLLGAGYFTWAAWFFAVAASCDALDGQLARQFKLSSKAGAFYDSFIDRAVEGIIYVGLAFYGQGAWLTWTAIAALVGSYLVSYARARGEALGVSCRLGIMQRPERLVALFVAILFSPLVALYLEPGVDTPVYHLAVGMTAIIAILSFFTAWKRARWIFEQLARPGSQYTKTNELASPQY